MSEKAIDKIYFIFKIAVNEMSKSKTKLSSKCLKSLKWDIFPKKYAGFLSAVIPMYISCIQSLKLALALIYYL